MNTKQILGLDLGVASIGFAHVVESEDRNNSEIKQIGVRVNSLTVDEQTNFEKGKPFSINAERTLKRGARRNLDRYQDRRKNLIEVLQNANLINAETHLAEDGKNTTHQTWALRAKAVSEQVEKEDFARILLAINKKRGYKSSRKAKNEDEGQAIDGMAIAKRLYEENLTPGQLAYELLKEGKKSIPDFYRSDLQAEFDKVWNFQKQFYPEILIDEFYKELQGKGQRATSAMFYTKYGFNTAENKGSRGEKKLQAYKWRSEATFKQLEKEEVAYALTEINNNLNSSSGYLGAISDRSKELYFNKQTVGQYLYQQLKKNPHTRLKNQVFYRQDYLDEFETIWETQAKFHSELTNELKKEIRDIIIFYQRKLKSQKGLISFCELESKEVVIDGAKKTIGARVAPKSSPLFQEFKIWQNLNNVLVRKKGSRKRVAKAQNQHSLFEEEKEIFSLDLEAKEKLFEELNLKGNLSAKNCLEILGLSSNEWELNYTQLEGNRTNKSLYEAYLKILDIEGYDVRDLLKVKSNKDEVELDDLKVPAIEIKNMVRDIFKTNKIDAEILDFDAEADGKAFEQQPSYQLWHLLYSYEGDDSLSGNEKLYELLAKKFGFKREHAQILANVGLVDDYGNLSSKAMRKIYPHIRENNYSTACEIAGYRHSKHSLTKGELKDRVLEDKLELLKKNSLRQPVVEKILNQMINVVNALIEKNSERNENGNITKYFKFDEIRIELARELKKNAAERAEMTTSINAAKLAHEKIFKILQNEFGIKNPTRNDIIRFRLYEELKNRGYKDLYTDTYIPREILFSKQIDIDHIIPQSRLFDDSFSNKTVVYRQTNLDKGNKTAFDYIKSKYGSTEDFEDRIKSLYDAYQKNKEEGISKAKYQKLLKQETEIGDGFIERDLRESQYIAKKAKELLFKVTRSVVSTSGSITDRLREDWDLINVMKELNLPKYKSLGLTEIQERSNGHQVEVIKDWTKRNDHRHHAMDALTVAFTKHNHIQYLNYLNARKNESHKLHGNIIAIETLETEVKIDDNGNKKRVFKEPIPNFRKVAKEHLENVLISHKAKNKVVTKNKNKISGKENAQITLTPRGQLHKETVYGKYRFYQSKEEKVSAKFDLETIEKVANPTYKAALLQRLAENGNDPKKAFSGKKSLNKTAIYISLENDIKVPETVKLVWLEEDYSIRKDVTPENFKDEKSIEKILDEGIKKILKNRLKEFGGDAKKAFTDLDKNPIYLNKENGITIKRIRVSGVKNAEPLHYKKDHFGNDILDENGKQIPADFVSTGNNHHVAIYQDENGNLQEKVVSFFEAVERVNQGLPIIDKTYNQHLGWQFLFTMKQNEMFVFPNKSSGFIPTEIDLLDPKNKKLISPNLFRVQTLSIVQYGNNTVRDFKFRHHLEALLNDKKELQGITFQQLKSLPPLKNIVKVRINHLGDIVSVGEY
ncbi:type II CRISPR RNA-guided endonuclease Cas9 [Parapedobacter soli]|uniref:type II CRISPR RNA-guided endonuclease Cas9 n=1 Tax=Parapedobacter soli TaxID=416955 RepID=UPI0021C5CD8A|nr:type II CRISPR RNA-guided endonuclease Cas9 [Parapedobacter soli]